MSSVAKFQICNSLQKKKMNALKTFAKTLRIKVGGRKDELINRLKEHIILSHFALKIQSLCCKHLFKKRSACTKIQSFFKTILFRKLFQSRGPAVLKRKLCNNSVDFLTGDSIDKIHINQFFSFADEDGFTYGFDIISIYTLVKNKTLQNPYNRKQFGDIVVTTLKTLVKLSKILKVNFTYLVVEEPPKHLTTTDRLVNIFKIIDSLGNYTSPSWILELNHMQLLRFLRELSDIWNYRSQMTEQIKRQICPPHGNPFRGYGHFYYQQGTQTVGSIQYICANVLESILFRSVDDGSKTLGAYLILSALTLVSHNAAVALPWLYDSVM